MRHSLAYVLPALMCAALLGGCDTFDHFQKPPDVSSPGSVSRIPPPRPDDAAIAAADVLPLPPAMRGSLWQQGAKTFFRDPRARGVGDLLTVAVNLQEQAEFVNDTTLSRSTQNSMTMPNIFGAGTILGKILSSSSGMSTSGSDSTTGAGDIKRTENVVVNVAATVVKVLPNKNLEISGSQEILLNNELRELQLRGIVRPEDIGSDNTISSSRIAEARIIYGGRGVSSDLQRPTWGQDILNRIQPF